MDSSQKLRLARLEKFLDLALAEDNGICQCPMDIEGRSLIRQRKEEVQMQK